MNTKEKVIALETEALNEWSKGNAAGYGIHSSANATYCDNLGAHQVLVGDDIKKYAETAFAELPEHKYEMIDVHVQDLGDSAVLNYQYQPFSLEGDPLTRWQSSVVYTNVDGEWKLAHSHWTMLQKPEE